MSYNQLTMVQRYQIEALRRERVSLSAIAKALGVHRSTIGREIRRNELDTGEYQAYYAQVSARLRYQRKQKNKKLNGAHQRYIHAKLKEGWSPEQIAGRMSLDGLIALSHETIYRYIYRRMREGHKELAQYLRHKHRKYKTRKGIYELRGKIPRAKPIHQRDTIVEEKSRIGDFEADTIIGKDHEQSIVTLVDRHSKFTLMHKAPSKEAFEVTQVIVKLMEPLKGVIRTITSDNGKEFANHAYIEQKLGVDFYFAEPYKSWQRGLNEHTNGLIREYIPKKTKFETISDKFIVDIQEKLNHRPRKILGYKTPHEVFFAKIAQWIDDSKLHYKNNVVALDC
ncbi:MAG: IS30 family transposase [Sulfuricurvum sp.]|jgi:IS30 family transposase|nr:IS30 family transposase [Sulfuricurvum sp.]MDP3119326.1 IS30 family transposase [Sulfuricurvum sp.]MDP3266224.1 IS30 family transposase [Sulfuricurvum sp.]